MKMRHRSNSLNKSSSFASLPLSRYIKDSDKYKNNSSDPGFFKPTPFNTTEKPVQFKFHVGEKQYSNLFSQNQNKGKKKILVLDLDDTLIHSIEATPNNQLSSNSIIPLKIRWKVKLDQKIREKMPQNLIKDKNSSNQECFFSDYNIINLRYHNRYFYVCERPNVRQFLHNVCDLFEVYIYTSGDKKYAKPIIDELCPMIDDMHRKYGDLCKVKYNRIYKDLYSFNCSFKDILIVDDNQENFFFWPKNSILCKPFNFKCKNGQNEENGDKCCEDLNYNGEDIALFIDQNYLMDKLLPILVKCASAKDVRKVICSHDVMSITQFNENNNGISFIGHSNPLHK